MGVTGLRTLFLLMIALLMPTALGSRARAEQGEGVEGAVQLLGRGIFSLKAKDFPGAKAYFERVVEIDPRNATAHYYLAVCDARAGSGASAAARLRTAVENGFPHWRKLRDDPFFDAVREDPAFREQCNALWTRYTRREEGILEELIFDFQLPDSRGTVRSPTEFRGEVLTVVLLSMTDVRSLEAALVLRKVRRDPPVPCAIVGIIEVPGKSPAERRSALAEFQSDSRIPFPLLLGTSDVRASLKPFRLFPTVVVLDPDGIPRRIVEGYFDDLEVRYREAMRAAATDKAAENEPETRRKDDSP